MDSFIADIISFVVSSKAATYGLIAYLGHVFVPKLKEYLSEIFGRVFNATSAAVSAATTPTDAK